MNRTARDRSGRHPKPVKHIEVFENHPKSRLVLTIVLVLIGVCALGYSLASYLTAETGWTTIEARSSKMNNAEELIFQYYLGAGEMSATAENKAVSALYTESVTKAYQLFYTMQDYINLHPNEEIEVDEALYEAFSTIEKYGNRAVYLAPIYVQYSNLFGCNDDVETVDFDPYQNEEIALYFAEIISFAGDKDAINIQLLGNHTIKLYVSEAYLQYASEIGFSEFIDFYWMRNAFIVDYIADVMSKNGFVRGSISSYDGFVRNLDDGTDMEYGFNIFGRNGNTIHQAGVMQYTGAMSIVYLRDYPANGLDWQHYYTFRNGETRTAYVDVLDGYCKSAINGLVSYSINNSCVEILFQIMPVYIADDFDIKKLSKLTEDEIYSIYCEGRTIFYNEPSLVLTEVQDGEKVQYTIQYIDV